ncbi:MAG TPA: type II toxin-antitoxin system prevent-host-death family antitoxin [Candidatus Baltobacteraceae bacterium]|nr:type II toxin-antitoxin system prevent-host-death family antitoxin [Candidatus Baltobacteraceae bacterium]
MKAASILEAKTHLSTLVRRVERGERITITRGGKPVAELVPSTQARRPFGIDEGTIHIAPDFDAPLPPEIAGAFGAE